MGAKFPNFIAIAILVDAVMFCWSAEAGPKSTSALLNDASAAITTRMERNYRDSGFTLCSAFNKNGQRDVCVAYDIYPYWIFGHPTHGTRWSKILPGRTNGIWAVHDTEKPSLQCKLSYAIYRKSLAPCP
jgi:hypothetical protein